MFGFLRKQSIKINLRLVYQNTHAIMLYAGIFSRADLPLHAKAQSILNELDEHGMELETILDIYRGPHLLDSSAVGRLFDMNKRLREIHLHVPMNGPLKKFDELFTPRGGWDSAYRTFRETNTWPE